MGFGAPLADWLRGRLRPWAEDVLTDSAIRRDGVLDPTAVTAAWQQFQATGEGFQRIWTTLQWLQWREVWDARA